MLTRNAHTSLKILAVLLMVSGSPVSYAVDSAAVLAPPPDQGSAPVNLWSRPYQPVGESDDEILQNFVLPASVSTEAPVTAPMSSLIAPVPPQHSTTPQLVPDRKPKDMTYSQYWKLKEANLLAIKNGTAQPRPVHEDSLTEAGVSAGRDAAHCVDGTCAPLHKLAPVPLPPSRIAGLSEPVPAKAKASGSTIARWSEDAWREATKPRAVAHMCGGGHRSGNVSKCACAAAVKDALLDAGICKSRPGGDAVSMNRTINEKSCPELHALDSKNPNTAPIGSTIVYWTSRHKAGHTESVIAAPPEAARAMGVPVGTKLWCSDFCRTGPFLGIQHGVITNHVETIFSL